MSTAGTAFTKWQFNQSGRDDLTILHIRKGRREGNENGFIHLFIYF